MNSTGNITEMIISRKEFNELAHLREEPSLSLFIPTFRAGENETNRIKWKNLCRDAEHKLTDMGYGVRLVNEILEPAKEKLDDTEFWSHMSDGYCAFLSRSYSFSYSLPIHFQADFYIADRFLISPLLTYFSDRQRFFLLLLSKDEVKFYEGNKHSISPVIINDLVPVKSERRGDVEPVGIQYHTAGDDAIFHGESGRDEEQVDLEKYFREVDDGLMQMLHDEKVPMVLAGVESLIPVYRAISRYNYITDDFIRGNVLGDDPVFLHEKAWDIINKRDRKENKINPVAFTELEKRGKASSELDPIARYAQEGRVETIYFQEDFYKNYDADTVWKINSCLLDAWMNGARVQVNADEMMPLDSEPLNVILRY